MKIKKIVIFLAICLFVFQTLGCGRPEQYGQKINPISITHVKDILSKPQEYVGKTVTVKGKITLVCQTGCWFYLKDDGDAIYIDLAPYGYAIPQYAGRTATAEGEVSVKDAKATITAKGVEIK